MSDKSAQTKEKWLKVMTFDCWHFDTNNISKDRYDTLESYLSESERSKALRFVFNKDRRKFVSRRGALRSILSNYTGCHPSQITYKYGKYGKPHISGSPYQFNASSSGSSAVMVIGQDTEIGVDIEMTSHLNDIQSLLNVICSEEEQEWISLFDNCGERELNIYRLWTIKEAYLKMRGCGLFVNPKDITIKTEGTDPNNWQIDDCEKDQCDLSIASISNDLPNGVLGHVVTKVKNKPISISHKHLL